MTNSRLTESEARALDSGRATASRPDRENLARSIAAYRAAALDSPVRPTTALSARLDDRVLRDLTASGVRPVQLVSSPSPAPARGWIRTALAWLAGLGLVTKIVVGVSIAAVATTGAGAAGVLPDPAQMVFDSVLPGLSPVEESVTTDETPGLEPLEESEPIGTPEQSDDESTDDSHNPGGGARDPDGMPGHSGENGLGDPNPTPGAGNNNGNGNTTPGEGNQGQGEGGGKPGDTPGGNANK